MKRLSCMTGIALLGALAVAGCSQLHPTPIATAAPLVSTTHVATPSEVNTAMRVPSAKATKKVVPLKLGTTSAQNPGVDLSAVDEAIVTGTADTTNPVFTQGTPENLAAQRQCRYDLTNGQANATATALEMRKQVQKQYALRMHWIYSPKVYPDVLGPGDTYNP